MKFVMTVVLLFFIFMASAGDVNRGAVKAQECAGCHGANGMSDYDLWPNLAGQHQTYLVQQLRDFRDGKRNNPWMSPMAKSLTDEEIQDLSAYFSQL